MGSELYLDKIVTEKRKKRGKAKLINTALRLLLDKTLRQKEKKTSFLNKEEELPGKNFVT